MTTATASRPMARATARFLDWLEEHGVPYQLHDEATGSATLATAWTIDINASPFARTVAATDDNGQVVMLVLGASATLDLEVAAETLHRRRLTLLTGADLERLAPDCGPDTVAPVEALCGFPVYADEEIAESPTVTFRAGEDRGVLSISRSAWDRAAGVAYSKLTSDRRSASEPIEWY